MSYHEGSNWQAKREDAGKPLYETTKWRRYRFRTNSVEDYRPLVFNPKYPWWCSGFAGDMSSATIVAYLPASEDLKKYWDDAFEIEFTEEDKITFSDRFPKPSYYNE
jgi:hypothetical protein